MVDLTRPAESGIILIDGLLAGLFIGSSLVEHAARLLAPSPWIAYKHVKEIVFAPIMPPVFLTCLASTATAAVFLPAHLLLSGAAALMALAFVITATVHLPLNAMFQSWTPTEYPVTWDTSRARWRNWNWTRTLLVVCAYGIVLAALR